MLFVVCASADSGCGWLRGSGTMEQNPAAQNDSGKVRRKMKGLLWICLTVSIILTSCGRIQTAQKEEAALVESDENYLVTKHEWSGMYFYDIVSRKWEGRRPLVLFLHGLGGKKEDVIAYARDLADQGYVVVAPDCVGHGESKTTETLNFFDVIERTAAGCGSILEYYQNSDYGDPSRFSLAGISMGGMTALYFGAYSQLQPTAIISICATADWESLLGTKEIYTKFRSGEGIAITDEGERNQMVISMVQNSPDHNLEYLLQVPILMINGREDEIVPVSGIEAFEVKAGLYSNHLECIIQDGRGHEVGDTDLNNIIRFLGEYMPVSAAQDASLEEAGETGTKEVPDEPDE